MIAAAIAASLQETAPTPALQGAFLIHFIISWCFRHRYYRLYLRVKHFVKNRTVWRHGTYGTMEMELPVREKGKGKSTRTSIA